MFFREMHYGIFKMALHGMYANFYVDKVTPESAKLVGWHWPPTFSGWGVQQKQSNGYFIIIQFTFCISEWEKNSLNIFLER